MRHGEYNRGPSHVVGSARCLLVAMFACPAVEHGLAAPAYCQEQAAEEQQVGLAAVVEVLLESMIAVDMDHYSEAALLPLRATAGDFMHLGGWELDVGGGGVM